MFSLLYISSGTSNSNFQSPTYQEPDKALESEKLIVIPVEDLPNND